MAWSTISGGKGTNEGVSFPSDRVMEIECEL